MMILALFFMVAQRLQKLQGSKENGNEHKQKIDLLGS